MIKFEHVSKSFDKFTALDNLSLEIKKGSAYGLLGSNGAGKSTLLRLLAGIYRQDKGRITIEGESVYDNPAVKKRLCYVSDETAQYNDMTMKDLKLFISTFYPAFSNELFMNMWGMLHLPENARMATFSKGMKRQAAVIAAMSAQPDYLLLDEAFDGLDPMMRIAVKKMLIDFMVERNATVVISSHNMKEIEEFCDTAGLMHKGAMLFSKELDRISDDVCKIQTSVDVTLSPDDFEGADITEMTTLGSVTTFIVKGGHETVTHTLSDMGARFVDIVPLSLEEVFLYSMEGLGYDYGDIRKQA